MYLGAALREEATSADTLSVSTSSTTERRTARKVIMPKSGHIVRKKQNNKRLLRGGE